MDVKCLPRHDMALSYFQRSKKVESLIYSWHKYSFCLCADPIDVLDNQWYIPYRLWVLCRLVFAFVVVGGWCEIMMTGLRRQDLLIKFTYLSYWSYLLATFNFVLEAAFLVYYRPYFHRHYEKTWSLPWPLAFKWIVNNINRTMSLMVCIVYNDFYSVMLNWHQFCLHFLSAAVVVLDLLLSKVPVPWAHFYHPALFAFAYSIFTYFHWVLGGSAPDGQAFIYPIYDWDQRDLTAPIGCVFAFCYTGLLHFTIHVVVKIRNRLTKKLFDTIK